MEISALFTGITATLKEVAGMVTTAFDFWGKGKVDKTEAMKQFYKLQLKIKELESLARELEHTLTAKLMVGATWIKPLVLVTGLSIISICIFNIVCRTFGWGLEVEIFTWEIAILLGMFIFLATGSVKLLTAVVEMILEWLMKNKKKGKQE